MMSPECRAEAHRRRRKDRRLVVTTPSVAVPILATLWVGMFLAIASRVVGAEDIIADPSPYESCKRATAAMLVNGSGASVALQDAIAKHAATLHESSLADNDEWRFGYSVEANVEFRERCEDYNKNNDLLGNHEDQVVFKHPFERGLTLTCDVPHTSITGRTTHFYGITECLVATDECKDATPMEMARSLWERLGLECHAYAGGSSKDRSGDGGDEEIADPTEEKDLPEAEAEMSEANKVAASNEKCLRDTQKLTKEHPHLATAIELGYVNYIDHSRDMKMGYHAADAHRVESICAEIGGRFLKINHDHLWCDVDSVDVTVELSNVVTCLAGTPECETMSLFHKLEERFKAMEIQCFGEPDDLQQQDQSSTEQDRKKNNKIEDNTIVVSPSPPSSPSTSSSPPLPPHDESRTSGLKHAAKSPASPAIAALLFVLFGLVAAVYLSVIGKIRTKRSLALIDWDDGETMEITFSKDNNIEWDDEFNATLGELT